MSKENIKILLGFVISNTLAFILLGVLYILSMHNMVIMLGYATFFVLPFIMGIICAVFSYRPGVRGSIIFVRILLNVLISLVLASVFLHEGVICLIIVSPLIVVLMYAGYLIAASLLKRRNNNLNFSVGGFLLLALFTDMVVPHSFQTSVSDVMIVNAPPQKVWPYVVSYPYIKEKSHYWFFDIGLPKPVATSVTGYHQGAGRKCIFEKNLVFDEKMTTYEPERNLTFDITGQPKDPELMGHINIERGQFILKDNHDGTTTLTGTSWYSLKVFPATYFDLWARSITRNVHLRVMEHIKNICENKVQ